MTKPKESRLGLHFINPDGSKLPDDNGTNKSTTAGTPEKNNGDQGKVEKTTLDESKNGDAPLEPKTVIPEELRLELFVGAFENVWDDGMTRQIRFDYGEKTINNAVYVLEIQQRRYDSQMGGFIVTGVYVPRQEYHTHI